MEELRSKAPSLQAGFEVQRRTTENLRMMGGNDYYILSGTDSVLRHMIEKELVAISVKDTLYLNTTAFMLPAGYSRALTEGKYIAFRSGFRDKKKGRIMAAAMALGLTGAMIAALSRSKSGVERFLFVLDTSDGMLYLGDRNYLLKIIRPYPDLEYQYALEEQQAEEETIIRYISMIDKAADH